MSTRDRSIPHAPQRRQRPNQRRSAARRTRPSSRRGQAASASSPSAPSSSRSWSAGVYLAAGDLFGQRGTATTVGATAVRLSMAGFTPSEIKVPAGKPVSLELWTVPPGISRTAFTP